MYPPLVLNGLKTRPGLPGTGLATGNCVALADFWGEGEGFAEGLFPATRDVACVDGRFDLRQAERGVAVGEGRARGRPGLDTSDADVAGAGSGLLRTYRTGAVMARPISWAVSQLTKQIAISVIAQRLQVIAILYGVFSSVQHITNEPVDFCLR